MYSLKETWKDHLIAASIALVPTLLVFWWADSLSLREDWFMAAILALCLHLSARLVILHLKVQRFRAQMKLREESEI